MCGGHASMEVRNATAAARSMGGTSACSGEERGGDVGGEVVCGGCEADTVGERPSDACGSEPMDGPTGSAENRSPREGTALKSGLSFLGVFSLCGERKTVIWGDWL